jgi:hypothetical protein
MAFDFPNSPTVGQKYPSPAVPNQPTYTWDGEKWVCSSVAIAGIGGGSIPSGSKMLFYMAAAPVGWTQDTTHNDKSLRVVSGAGGGSGGSNNFSTVQAQTTVGGHTLTVGETAAGITSNNTVNITVNPGSTANFVPFSDGGWSQTTVSPASTNVVPISSAGRPVGSTTALSGNNAIPVTSNNTSGSAHNHPITMDVKYVDMIIASKD